VAAAVRHHTEGGVCVRVRQMMQLMTQHNKHYCFSLLLLAE
jgi:hypothetical protein